MIIIVYLFSIKFLFKKKLKFDIKIIFLFKNLLL